MKINLENRMPDSTKKLARLWTMVGNTVNHQPSTLCRHRSSNHYPITGIWQLKPLVTHFRVPDMHAEDSFILLRVPG